MHALDLLLRRRSVLARNLGEPGPSDAELEQILRAAARVPDHGKLAPWRFILIRGETRSRLGQVLVDATRRADPAATAHHLEIERDRFLRAPLVVSVVSCVRPGKIQEWEQVLSSGAVCQNMLNAVHASGYHGQWLTEWYAYDALCTQALGLAEGERVAGFIYIGTGKTAPDERPRPDLGDIITEL